MRSLTIALLFFLFYSVGLFSQGESEKTEIEFHGFVRLNATVDFQDLGNSDLFRPAQIQIPAPVSDPTHFYMSAKQSRFGLKAKRTINGEVLKARIEVDFHNTSSQTGGLIRLRHAYLQYKGFTVGQAWTTFYDIKIRPNIVNLEGANGSTLNRAPLIRYDHNWKGHTLSLALENPVEQLTISEQMEISKQLVPDVVIANKFYWNNNKNSVKIAAIGRQLRYEVPSAVQEEVMVNNNIYTGGAMMAGRIHASESNLIKFELVGGKGLARYIRGVRNLGYDAICRNNCIELEAIPVFGGFFALEHDWAPGWSSTLLLGGVDIAQPEGFEADDMDYCLYGSANLFYQPVEAFSIGLEYLYGERTNIDGLSGTTHRVAMGVMMTF